MDYLCDTVSVHPQYTKSILISLITTGLSPGKQWVGLQLLIVINKTNDNVHNTIKSLLAVAPK